MRTFDVIDTGMRSLTSGYSLVFDSLQAPRPLPGFTVTDALKQNSAFNFKEYGPGQLSTPTFRGGDANQTQVLWNGMRLNSPMLGSLDFNTLAMGQFSSVAVITGTSSNLHAQGGLGGVVALSQPVDFQSTNVSVGQSFGSFETYHTNVSYNKPFKLGRTQYSFNTYLSRFVSQNNFPFMDIYAKPYQRRVIQEGMFTRNSISSTVSALWGAKWQSTFTYWFSDMARLIPQPINVDGDAASQYDRSHRALLSVQFVPSPKFQIKWNTLVEQNQNKYSDERISISNNNMFRALQNRADLVFDSRKFNVGFVYTNQFVEASSENYAQPIMAMLNAAVVKASYTFLKKRILVEAGYRWDQFQDINTLLPFGGLSIKPTSVFPLSFVVSASKTIRLPTLNELYWTPGGDVTIKPERGNLLETGLKWNAEKWKGHTLAFFGKYENRIRWLPSGLVFEPTNIDRSAVKGIDIFFEGSKTYGKNKIVLRTVGQYIQATGMIDGRNSYTLSYIPEWSGLVAISLMHKLIALEYSHEYLGQRYINNDETAYMPDYNLGNLALMYALDFKQNSKVYLSTSVRNLFDRDYQNMPWRPMPGRTLNVKFDWIWSKS